MIEIVCPYCGKHYGLKSQRDMVGWWGACKLCHHAFVWCPKVNDTVHMLDCQDCFRAIACKYGGKAYKLH